MLHYHSSPQHTAYHEGGKKSTNRRPTGQRYRTNRSDKSNRSTFGDLATAPQHKQVVGEFCGGAFVVPGEQPGANLIEQARDSHRATAQAEAREWSAEEGFFVEKRPSAAPSASKKAKRPTNKRTTSPRSNSTSSRKAQAKTPPPQQTHRQVTSTMPQSAPALASHSRIEPVATMPPLVVPAATHPHRLRSTSSPVKTQTKTTTQPKHRSPPESAVPSHKHWAAGAYTNSPHPSMLPMPVFGKQQQPAPQQQPAVPQYFTSSIPTPSVDVQASAHLRSILHIS